MATTEQTDRSTEEQPSGWSLILWPVFIPSAVAIIALLVGTVILSRVAGDEVEEITETINTAISDGVGWWYVFAVNVFLLFSLYCAFSKVGHIRLGRDGEEPEFGVISWFLMLFSAGMGIGLVFFGVAEPLSHYVIPPESFGNDPASDQAARESVGLMMLQWGLHPWGIYAVVGLGLAYMSFRRGRPLAVRWLLEPLIGRKRVEGWMGHTIDTVAIIGTLFGIATSFGFGITQIVGGFEFLGWAEGSNALVIGLIAGITAIAVWSVVSGVHKGLKWLSNFNMSLAALFALTVFLLGPTVLLLQLIPQNLGEYISQLPVTMFNAGGFADDGWEAEWTIGYWGWWTSWAPFVGMFIARISRGRTIREFVGGVLLAPTLASLVWFTVFGGSAIQMQADTGALAAQDPETGEYVVDSDIALFQFLEAFPGVMPLILSVVAMFVIVFFFVTSSDSGSLVIDMLASGGSTETPTTTRVFWAVLEGLAAAVLLVVGGATALTALQTLALSTAAPFSVILVLACISLMRAFRWEVANMPMYVRVEDGGSSESSGASGASVSSQPQQAEPERRSRRERVRGEFAGISATLGGLTARPEEAGGDPRILSLITLPYSDMRVDPETGEPMLVDEVEDPLAGETFESPEFEDSQEYLNQDGSEQDEEGADDYGGATVAGRGDDAR
ncbi:MAG: BCCT family transporter [Mobilicoccus sp.]|nr:BCCT family transporter [Mobilicoccus sp.]